jgi:uncharacterized membrane protein
VALAAVLLYLDRHVISGPDRAQWLYGGGADGARTMLSTIAGSVITVAGVVFSITIAALTQASSQFGPRLLRNFMRDTANQFVLGIFVATFLYCLLILRTIHGGDRSNSGEFVPQASVTVAVLMAAASIGVLIYFIHHVSVSLQAPSVVATAQADLEKVIARLPEDQSGSGVARGGCEKEELPPDFHASARAFASTSEGYVQAIDYEGLMQAAAEADVIVQLEHRPGDHVILGNTLALVWPADRAGAELREQLNGAFMCGRHSTPEQDVEYAIRQMVEIAVRALSPGINDPFTAVNCIDALSASICRVARVGLPGPLRYDHDGRLRLVTPVTTFDGILDTAFNQIRQYGRESVAVTVRLLEVFEACGQQMSSEQQRRGLLRHAEMVYQQSAGAIPEQRDREDVRQRWEAVALGLGNVTAQPPERPSSPDRAP